MDNIYDLQYKQAKQRVHDYIDMLYIQYVSKLRINKEISIQTNMRDKTPNPLTTDLIEEYLRKRGYVLNVMLKKPIWTRDFTCVSIMEDHVEIWHDIPKSKGPVVIHNSLLTGLPITLKYMEKI